jgi:chemotaxis protein methyltransferase CheR
MQAGEATDKLRALELALLLEGLYQMHGADFRGHEQHAMQGKVEAFVQAHQLPGIAALQERILRDGAMAAALIGAISQPFAAPWYSAARWQALREAVLPLLRSTPWARVWVADCSQADPVISLATMLEQEGLYERTQLFVTAASAEVLDEVSQLRLPQEAIAQYSMDAGEGSAGPALAAGMQACTGGYSLQPALRRNIIWGQHDMGCDASFNEFQLIVCQRPLAEYGPALRRRALRLFSDSLCPFGVLQLTPRPGDGDPMFAFRYNAVSPEHGLYRKAA